MVRFVTCLLAMATATLGGCSRSEVECTSESATSAVQSLLHEQMERAVRDSVRSDSGERLAANARVRAIVRQAQLSLADVRTAREDPNSTKRFCEATLVMTLTAQAMDEAEKGRELARLDNLTSLSDRNEAERAANAFRVGIEFNVQPTDEGDRVFAEIENRDTVLPFLSEVLVAQALKPHYERLRVEQDRAAAEQRRLEEERTQALQQAEAARRTAVLDEARADHRLAGQAFDAVWFAIDQGVRRQLLDGQRAWARRRDAECMVESASSNIDATDREAARLRCLARFNRMRASDLRRYVGY